MSVSKGDKKKHNIESIVESDSKCKKVQATDFSFVVNQISKELAGKNGGIVRAYNMISAEMPVGPYSDRATPEEIAQFHLGSRQVPAVIFHTAKDILRMLRSTSSGNGTRGELYAWERAPDARTRLQEKLGYTLGEDLVPRFAFNAMLKRILENTEYDSIPKVCRESAKRRCCSMNKFRQAAENEDDCHPDVYLAAVNIMLTDKGIPLQHLEKISSMQIHIPKHYNAAMRYIPGQILVFSDEAGSVLDKSGKDKILVAQYTGRPAEYIEREYVEGLQHDDVRTKFAVNSIIGVSTSTLNASIRRYSGPPS
ncbi:MAG: hypothetical protein V1729_03085 [Candidatus Woesearchaeota archaeon]